jgi:hypothetical protein
MPIILDGLPTSSASFPWTPSAPYTLMDIEREVARRTGPFFQAAQDSTSPTTSTTIAAVMPTLRSSAVLGGPENLFLVRRGILADGTPTTAPIIPDDRVRMVQTFDSATGRVVIDRNWRDVMYPNELADLIHLHPTQELHVAVMNGLRRCFFEDTRTISPSSSDWWTSIDLTAQMPWLTDPRQIRSIRYGYGYPGYPSVEMPYDTYQQNGHLILTSQSVVGGVWLSASRPAWSLVNGTDSTTGPTVDNDTLAIDLDYAAAAGHIEAWHAFPSRCQAAAAGGIQASQQMAAVEFTRQALIWNPPPPRTVGFSTLVGVSL